MKKRNYKRIENSIVKSFIYNMFMMAILLMLFEPTAKWDDYEMTQTLYGACSGNYSHVVLWGNILWGYLIEGLLKIFPTVSWYYVTQYVGMFLAFTIFSYILIERKVFAFNRYLVWPILLIMQYEFYIRITFTKTAGLLVAVGIIWLLFLIESGCKKPIQYILGIILVLMGDIVRVGLLNMNLFICFSAFIIYVSRGLLYKKQKKETKQNMVKGITVFVGLVLIMLFASKRLSALNYNLISQEKGWEGYLEYNGARASIIDYSLGDYETYKKEYEKLGISENDLKMWINLGLLTNPKTLTIQRMKDIRSIYVIKKETSVWQSFVKASRNLLKYLTKDIVFYAFLMAVMLCIKCQGMRGFGKASIVTMFSLGSYYYLYWRGRTGHHVDVVIFMMGAFLALYYCSYDTNSIEQSETIRKKHWNIIIGVIGILAFNYGYNLMTSSSYYGDTYEVVSSQKEKYQSNYNLLKKFSQDKEHMYIMRTKEANVLIPCFTVPQMIEKGFYHNIYRMHQYSSPEMRTPLKEFNIPDDDPMSVITDDERIYYCSSVEDQSQIDIIVTYLREHFNTKARAYEAKKIDGVTLYQFVSKEPELGEIQDVDVNSIEYGIKKKNNEQIEGYAYIPGDNSYTEKIYLEFYNPDTGEYHYDYTTQVRSNRSIDENNGKYGGFVWENQGEWNTADYQVSLVLKSQGRYYRIPI